MNYVCYPNSVPVSFVNVVFVRLLVHAMAMWNHVNWPLPRCWPHVRDDDGVWVCPVHCCPLVGVTIVVDVAMLDLDCT